MKRLKELLRLSVRLCAYGLASVGALTVIFAALAIGPLRDDVRDAATLIKARLVLRALWEERQASFEAERLLHELRWTLEGQEPIWGRMARLPIDDAGPPPLPAPEPAPEPAATVPYE